MNRKRNFVLVLLAAAVLVLIWYLRPRPNQEPPPEKIQTQATTEQVAAAPRSPRPVNQAANQSLPGNPVTSVSIDPRLLAEQKSNQVREYLSMWRTPLLFYGKVIDENAKPIAGVRVSYSANSVDETLTKDEYNQGTVTTDERGIFKIDGIRGVGFMLQLEHPDYYSYSSNRTGFDIRSYPSDGISPDSEENAQVFQMHHKGNPVALIDRHGGLHKPADGTTMDFPLRGKTRGEIIGQLQAQAWKGEPDPRNDNHYDWKVKITVTGGGVLATSNEFDFVAPESGYQQTLEIGMSKDDPNWKPSTNEKLFFKLPNYFARGQADIDLYHDFYFSMQYFVNPDGSGNLENDPSQPFQEQ